MHGQPCSLRVWFWRAHSYVAWVPALAFTSNLATAGIFCWGWIMSAVPHRRLQLLSEVCAAWIWTVRQGYGLFSGGSQRMVRSERGRGMEPASKRKMFDPPASPSSVQVCGGANAYNHSTSCVPMVLCAHSHSRHARCVLLPCHAVRRKSANFQTSWRTPSRTAFGWASWWIDTALCKRARARSLP